MNTLKIVMSGEGKGTKIHFFSGFTHLIMSRGVFGVQEGTGTVAIENGDSLPHKLDKIIGHESDTEKGLGCKIFVLDMEGDTFLTIGTRCRAFLLGEQGQTIEAMY